MLSLCIVDDVICRLMGTSSRSVMIPLVIASPAMVGTVCPTTFHRISASERPVDVLHFAEKENCGESQLHFRQSANDVLGSRDS